MPGPIGRIIIGTISPSAAFASDTGVNLLGMTKNGDEKRHTPRPSRPYARQSKRPGWHGDCTLPGMPSSSKAPLIYSAVGVWVLTLAALPVAYHFLGYRLREYCSHCAIFRETNRIDLGKFTLTLRSRLEPNDVSRFIATVDAASCLHDWITIGGGGGLIL